MLGKFDFLQEQSGRWREAEWDAFSNFKDTLALCRGGGVPPSHL